MLRCTLMFLVVALTVTTLLLLRHYSPTGGALRGVLTDIGVKGGRTVTQMTFDQGEVSEAVLQNHLTIALVPDAQNISHGARLSRALTSGKRIFGYKYTSRDASAETEAKARADNGEPLTYSALFPGQFFVSDAERSAGTFIADFEAQKNISFLPLSQVTLKRNARYVMIAMDVGTIFAVRGLPPPTLSFASPQNYTTNGKNPSSIAMGDINGDGNADIAITGRNTNDIALFINNSDGSFGAPVSLQVGQLPHAVAIGDMNDDGHADLLVSYSSNVLEVYRNNGDGTFAEKEMMMMSGLTGPLYPAIGDLNGDGRMDFAVADLANYNVVIRLKNIDGTFGAQVSYPVTVQPYYLAFQDMNASGVQDLVVAHNNNGNSIIISTLLNGGNGTFSSSLNDSIGYIQSYVAIGDLNDDAKGDLVVVNGDNFSVLPYESDGNFGVHTDFSSGPDWSVYAVVGDVNGDGKNDVVTANTNSISVSLNTSE